MATRLLPLLSLLFSLRAVAVPEYDVVVYGSTPAGVLAAVAAAGEGARVALIDPRGWVGGAMSGGLGITDIGTTTAVIGGRTKLFFEAVTRHYASPVPLYNFEPHVAEKIFWWLLNETTVTVSLNTRITGLTLGAGARIASAQLAAGGSVSARVWIDTSYEGFLLPLANVSFHYGRESTATYNESIAGVLPVPHPVWTADKPFVAQPQIFTGVNGRAPDGSLLPGVSAAPGAVGSADAAIQAYSFRTTMTKNATNMLRPWPRPPAYDPSLFALILNGILYENKTTFDSVIYFGGALPCVSADNETCSNKGDCNNHKFAQFYLAAAYPPAVAANDWDAQQAVWDAHRNAYLGLYYFLATDASVPQSIRDSAYAFGLPLDEHVACDHFPCQLYVREALRMVSDFVLTQADIFDDVAQPDSVGRGSYSVDIMHASTFYATDASGDEVLTNEAGMQGPSFLNTTIPPFQIPYRALVPRAAEATNLLVPVALSASHVGFNAVRLEPTWMTIGESAGVAAAMAAREDVDVQRVNIAELQARLWQLGQVL
jgi:hypothetical protein